MSDLSKLMQTAFGCSPQVTAAVPGRVNLIGEHIDYNGGTVLPAALKRQVVVGLAAISENEIAITSSRFGSVVRRPRHDPKRGDWTDYAVGAIDQAEALGWLDGGMCLAIESDLPDGAGVSSSAALITAILRAAASFAGITPDPIVIATAARAVENNYIGMPCGIMDQMAVSLAAPGTALALNTTDLSYETLQIPQDWHFLTIHTGIRRELSDGRYKARFEDCQAAKDILQTDNLCVLSPTQQERVDTLPPPLDKRVRHTVSEHDRTLQAIAALKDTDLARFAQLMRESHHSYSADFEASLPEIDQMVEDAVALGAAAARLTGGGFGGCLVVLVNELHIADWPERFLRRHPKAWLI